jgi:hypothetical protein
MHCGAEIELKLKQPSMVIICEHRFQVYINMKCNVTVEDIVGIRFVIRWSNP